MNIGSSRFLCGRKGKFGFNMQAICDSQKRFLSVWILHPASSSDYLAYVRSAFYGKCRDEVAPLLKPGLVLFGDNAYVSGDTMVTPYKSAKSGLNDDFNFYHSQVRINIECAFGMLVHRWAILRRPLPAAMGIKKQIAVTMALCRLHNFCIGPKSSTDSSTDSTIAVGNLMEDHIRVVASGGVEVNSQGVPPELLGVGHHFDDICEDDVNLRDISIPRRLLKKKVETAGLHRTVTSRKRSS